MTAILAVAMWGTLRTCSDAPVTPAASQAEPATTHTLEHAPELRPVITEVWTWDRGSDTASGGRVTPDLAEHRAITASVSDANRDLTRCYTDNDEAASEASVTWVVGALGYTEVARIDDQALMPATRACLQRYVIRLVVGELEEPSSERRWRVSATLRWTP